LRAINRLSLIGKTVPILPIVKLKIITKFKQIEIYIF